MITRCLAATSPCRLQPLARGRQKASTSETHTAARPTPGRAEGLQSAEQRSTPRADITMASVGRPQSASFHHAQGETDAEGGGGERRVDVAAHVRAELEGHECAWSIVVRPTLPYKSSVWHIAGAFLGPLPMIRFRCVSAKDVPALLQFVRSGLSDQSRELFAPYPYYLADDELAIALRAAIQDSVDQRSLSFVVTARDEKVSAELGEATDQIVAHAFLWAVQSPVPELGIAVMDSFQGQGLGKALMALLVACARTLGKDAVELTTMMQNERARKLYLACGFEELGTILNPLGCDVTAAFQGRATPTHIGNLSAASASLHLLLLALKCRRWQCDCGLAQALQNALDADPEELQQRKSSKWSESLGRARRQSKFDRAWRTSARVPSLCLGTCVDEQTASIHQTRCVHSLLAHSLPYIVLFCLSSGNCLVFLVLNCLVLSVVWGLWWCVALLKLFVFEIQASRAGCQ